MNELEERILLELQKGNQKALEDLFAAYFNLLCRYAEEILKDTQDAEDVVIHLFTILWEERNNINIHTSIRSYLYRSTYNACINVLRKKKTENKYKDFFIHHIAPSEFCTYESTYFPLYEIIDKELVEEYEKVINALPPECRKIFFMSRNDGLSHQNIAAELDISVNTVKSQIMKALKKIQSELKKILILLPFLFG